MVDRSPRASRQDVRSDRTRQALRQALVNLTRERGYANVSVQDLAERAGVHRTTFYRYYQDKYDIVQDVLNDLSECLEAARGRLSGPLIPQTWLDPASAPPELALVFLEHVEKNADFYRLMLGANGMPAFFLEVHGRLEEFLDRLLGQHLLDVSRAPVPPALCAPVLASMGISIMLWWLRSGLTPERAQVARWLVRLEVVGLLGGALPGERAGTG
ncbi:hypothetical protein Dcar01_01488 [Deinococcus carri]|uniref:TetR family transcriptional regulator n=1 Tax=Deinococcus carri TaxID=1211323 RepID=A0ABP9W610_9DEIO